MVLGVSTTGLLKSMGSDGAFFENIVMQQLWLRTILGIDIRSSCSKTAWTG